MRLYLAGSDLGGFKKVLINLVGKNRKTLIITNARDHRSVDSRKEIVDEDTELLNNCGFIVTELDLRKYFNKATKLRKYIDELNPGLVFAMGGNLYSLATTLHLSGMDDILREDLVKDKYVYGGYSAGAIVTSHDLMNYADSFGRRSSDRLEQAKELYGEIVTEGLGLLNEYIIPHADEEKFKATCVKAEAAIAKKGLTSVVLNNADAVIVNGNGTEILRK